MNPFVPGGVLLLVLLAFFGFMFYQAEQDRPFVEARKKANEEIRAARREAHKKCMEEPECREKWRAKQDQELGEAALAGAVIYFSGRSTGLWK